MYILVFKQLFVMMLIVLISFFFCKSYRFGDDASQFLSRLLLYVINPCLMINAFDIQYDSVKLRQFLVVFVISFLSHFVMTIVSFVAFRSKTDEERKRSAIDRLAVVFTNCGFIGIPLINGVFGSQGVFYLMGYIAAFNLYFWTYGEYVMTRKMSIKKVITNPNILAVLVGFILFCLPVRLPEMIKNTIIPISELNTALSMILIGLLFANFRKLSAEGTSYSVRVTKTIVSRLVVAPFVVLLILVLASRVFARIPDIRTMLFVVLIAAACPIGMNISSFAVIFKRDASYGSLIVLLSSAICIATVPLFVKLAEVIM